MDIYQFIFLHNQIWITKYNIINITYLNLNNKLSQRYYANLYKINQTILECQYPLKIIAHLNNNHKIGLI